MRYFFRWSRRTGRKYSPKQGHTRPTRLSIESLEARTLVTADILTGVPLAMYSTADSGSSGQSASPLAAVSTQTASPAAAATQPVAQLILTITDANDQPITTPLKVGQQFWVDISVQDLRTGLSDAGVDQVAANITWDPSLASSNGAVVATSNYSFGTHGDVSTPGTITNIGGLEQPNLTGTGPTFAALGNGVQLVARAPMIATGGGTIQFDTSTPMAESLLVVDAAGTENDGSSISGALNNDEVQQGSTSATIIAEPVASIAGSSTTAGASASSVSFTVSLSAAEANPVTLNYQTQNAAGDNAVAGTDYTATSNGQVVIPANTTTATIQVPVAANTTFQASKTFHVALTSLNTTSTTGTATISPTNGSAQGTINYTPPTVSVQNASVSETTSAQTQMTFQVNLSAASDLDTTVNYQTVSQAGDTAVGGSDITTAGVDYKSLNAQLVIPAGQTSGTVTVPIAAETPGADKTFHLVLSSPSNATLGTPSTAVGTIQNFVGAPTVSVADTSASNGAAGATMNFAVTLSAPSTSAIVLDYQTVSQTGDTAVAGTDYTGVTNGQITIPANTTTINIPIQTIGTSTFEPTKTFHLQVSVDASSPGRAVAPATPAQGTINSANAQPTVSIADSSVSESTSTATTMNFTVTLSAASGQDTTVQYNTATLSGDTATGGASTATQGVDYQNVPSGTLVIPAGQLTGTVSIPIGAEVAGPSKTFHVVLSSATGGGQLGTAVQAQGTISNTLAQPAATLQPTATLAEPASGSQNMNFTVTLSAPSSVPVSFNYATRAVSAVAGTDYGTSGQASEVTGTVTFAPFQTTATISIPILANVAFNANSTFDLTLSTLAAGASNGTIAAGASVGTIAFNPAIVTVQNGSVTETTSTATTMQFTVNLSTAANQAVVVNYQTVSQAGDNAVANVDYTPVTAGTLTIPVGQTSGTFTIPILALGHGANKTFHVQLLNSTIGATLGTASSALGTIVNNVPAPTVSIGATQTIANTATGATLTLPITFSGDSDQPIILDYTTQVAAGDTAVAGQDFGTAGGGQVSGQITIPANMTSVTSSITIPIIGSSIFEPGKTFHVNISVDSGSTGQATITNASTAVTVTSAVAAPTVAIQAASVTETTTTATTMNFPVSLVTSGNTTTTSGQDVTITYQTQTQTGDSALGGSNIGTQGVDYQSVVSGTLVIPAGQSTGTISIPIAAEVAGSNKTFHVVITGVSGGAQSVTATTQPSAQGTIVNSVPKPSASIQATASQAAPASGATATMTFNVTLSAPSSDPVTLNYSTSDLTAKAGTDYSSVTAGTISFAPFQTTATATVGLLADSTSSVSTSFAVDVVAIATNGVNTATIAVGHAVGTITPAGGTFSGFAYVDTNNDGIMQGNERGLGGVNVTLTGTTTSGQSQTMTTTTGPDGSYSFTNVLAGNYSVSETAPAQYQIGQATGAAGVTATSGTQFSFTMVAGAGISGNDFGDRGLQPQFVNRGLFLSSIIQ